MKLTGKMEQWIESRLWHLKIDNGTITIRQILSELTSLFGISLTPGSQKQLEAEIGKIRSRIYKRHKRWLRRRAQWAGTLGVPKKMIQRWFRAGWIDPGKLETIHRLADISRVEVIFACIVSVFDSVCRAFVDEEYSI